MKLLITEACQIAGEAVSQHADVGAEVDLPKDEAILMARMGRALFLDKGDDPSKGSMTAGAEEKAEIKKRVAAIAAERKARDEAAQVQSPTGMAALIAQSVASAVQAAMQAGQQGGKA